MAAGRERVHFDRFQTTTTGSGFQTIRTYQVAADSLGRYEFTLVCLQNDKVHRASFKRVALFYRLGSNPVLLEGPNWHTPETIRTSNNIEVRYVLGSNTISIQVKNATTTATRWHVITDKLELK